jgi:superfamily II DNA helicase RecQ
VYSRSISSSTASIITSNPTVAAAVAAAVSAIDDSFVRAPPDLVPIRQLPPNEVKIIKDAMAQVFGIHELRDFQIEAVHYLTFHDNPSLVLLRRTADGKSLVPLTTSIIRCGITLVLVPLHGLGSDQVDKAMVLDHGVEAYYIDEHKAENARVLEQRLHSYTYSDDEKGCSSIIIFASPNALRTGSRWLRLLSSMAAKDMISMLAIDESHEVHQSGRSFCPEFLEAVDNLKILFDSMPRPVPRLMMSAIMTQEDVDLVCSKFGVRQYAILCGS